MKRRPHWTDDLIEAVKDAISGWCFDHVEGPLYDEDVYPVIAAVEDWQVDHPRPAHLMGRYYHGGMPQIIEEQAVAIQRVREFLADKDEGLTDDARAQGHFILVDTDSVRRALDGDNDA